MDAIPRTQPAAARTRPSRLAGFLFGMGLGGFVDGIVLHQILQWHHMLSHTPGHPVTTVAGLEVNTLADGFFHLAMWLLVLAASISMITAWRRGRVAPNWNFHFGLVLMGWGTFNIVEGLIDHHVLRVHHVRDDLGGPLSWDIGFLLVSVLLIGAGWLLHQRGGRSLERQSA